jgi:NADPH-dependent 2,4-dienoyl-CoA reductase/sulfur reductase-like enzyme/rhodanese-related sulfurtransferase
MNRIVIIGGLSAGPSAAAKARREDEFAEILMFEKTADISYATCGIPYALSKHIKTREKLLVTDVELLRKRFKIDVHLNEEVTDIDVENQKVITPQGAYPYTKLVFATGARSFVPPIENLNAADNWSTCRSLGDYDHIMQNALSDEAEHITVMGAGLIGIEVAENLVLAGKKVTIIEGGATVLPMWTPKFSAMAQNVLEDKGIHIIKNTFVKKVIVENSKIKSIDLGNGAYLDTDYVIMSVGIKPNTELLISKGAKAIPNGALIVNEGFETSLPNIYAAGDNASILNLQNHQQDYLPLGTHSNKGGRAAGFNAVGGHEILSGGYKTAIVQLFDFTLARTGMGPRDLEKNGISFKKALIVANSTPSYYPNPKDIIVEIYYNQNDHTLLGAEIFGEVGVDKRVDVLSTAIYAKLKVTDLPQLDLAYAPPYSPAKDAVVVSGFTAINAINHGCSPISVEELHDLLYNDADIQVVDVRNPGERANGKLIEGSVNVPLDELRENLDKINKNRLVVLHCARGLRGYIAAKILFQHGYANIKNLAGGYKVWAEYERQYPVHYRLEFELT